MAGAHAAAASPRASRSPEAGVRAALEPEVSDDKEGAQESVWHIALGRVRAQRQRLRERARLTALDKIERVIASLQRLRLKLGAAEPEHDRRGRGAAGRDQASRDTQVSAETATTAPPKRRLRNLLLLVLVLLGGAIMGMGLSFQLLEHLLDKRGTELARAEAKLAKNLKSMGRLEGQAERARERQERAEERLAKRIEESEAKISELNALRQEAEAQRSRMEAQLERAFEARSASPMRAEVPRPSSTARISASRRARSGNCTLSGGDVGSVLKGCIDELDKK